MRGHLCTAFVVVLCACRADDVDGLDGGGSRPTDAATGIATDASRDLPRDAATDTSIDATPHSMLDAATDASLDATVDAMPDATLDDTADASIDASIDTLLDATLDAATDAPDASPDATTISPDGAVAPVSLEVTTAGSGAGSVTSNPVGITCSSGTCSADFDEGAVITLSAEPSMGSMFTGWTGACTGTAECVVDLDGSKSVTATFALQSFTLEITKSGDGFGKVTGSGLDCGATCMVSLPYGTMVTLTSTASSVVSTLSTLAEWSGAGCSGTSSCTFMITGDTSVDAAYKLAPNLMFTTSSVFTGNLGGLAGADAKCQALAGAQSLSGTYRAYLGAAGTNAPTRFTGASGWTLVNGQALVNAIGDFGTTLLPHAPTLDEIGNDLSNTATVRVWTATQADTSYIGTNCNNAGLVADWSTTAGNTMSGVCTATSSNVLVGGSVYPCAAALRLYCFGIDRAATLP